MNTEPNISNPLGQNAVSVYQDNAMDDFPVLKAFQQYIDAEQEKARKRMVSICICFGVLIGIVIAVFLTMLYTMSERNQSLNDRLVEYAISDRDRDREAAAVPQSNPQTEAALKAMTETLAALQKQLLEEKKKNVAPVIPVKSAEQIAFEERQREETEKLIRAKALLEAEKKHLAEEKERLRQEEIERHRRRLYPEYYQNQKGAAATVPATPSPAEKKHPQLTDADIADILREADAILPSQETALPAKKSATPSQPPTEKKAVEIDEGSAIKYFKEDEEYQIPVDIKGKKSSWRVPLD